MKTEINEIWNQTNIPVIYRRETGPVLIRMPYEKGNRNWLRDNRRNKPVWNQEQKYWEIPKSWFNDTVARGLSRFNKIYIIQPHRVSEICAPACWNAKGFECNCSCLGKNHGASQPGNFFIVSDSFAFIWGGKELACRLLIKS
jgi:hypothetical protein